MKAVSKHTGTGIGAILILFALTMTLCADQAKAQPNRSITIDLRALDVGDEDDPLSNDEPYLVVVRFRFRVTVNANQTASIVPGTVQVSRVGDRGHNNLGRNGDNWCDEDDDPYWISSLPVPVPGINIDARLRFTESVPANQPGWFVGAAVVLMEEDGFSKSTAGLLTDRIVTAVRTAVNSLNFGGVNTNSITNAVRAKVERDLSRAVKNVDFGGIIRGIASAADPDDFGGVNVVIGATVPGGGLRMLAGAPPASIAAAAAASVAVTTERNFTLRYPIAIPGNVPSSARFQGRLNVRGQLRTSVK